MYNSLKEVFDRAFMQASEGKGKERHNKKNLPFEEQPIISICERLGSNHFACGQALKKIEEAAGMAPSQAIHELLGAMVYLAAAIIYLERTSSTKDKL